MKPKIFVTSDTHFNHINILKYESETRPFESVEEMNETIIANWNSVVGKEDIVYHLGDFFMGKLDEIEPILERLNGHIILIRGNHDSANRIELFKQHGIIVKDIDFITYKGRYFIMCHFPIANDEFIKMVRQDNSEVVDLYGHVHSNTEKGFHDGMYHVGMDTNDLTPITLEQIWSECWHETMSNAEKKYREEHEKICFYENLGLLR